MSDPAERQSNRQSPDGFPDAVEKMQTEPQPHRDAEATDASDERNQDGKAEKTSPPSASGQTSNPKKKLPFKDRGKALLVEFYLSEQRRP